ncbi:enzymatic polyprotein endonuclease reverse-like protein, partial [Leptotrombidium deliense]
MYFLRYVLNNEGILPDIEKIIAVKQFPTPENIDNVRSFLGLASYYRRFVKDFAKIAKPLTFLTKKDVAFKWSTDQINAFVELKNRLINYPVLVHFDPSYEIEVRCDASGEGLGAILLQITNDGAKVIMYASRCLSKHEKNYSISELEALAIVFALQKFRIYLIGRKFKVYSDHCSLCWLTKKQNLSARLARWALVLQDYDFEVIYKSSKKHSDADCLSRNPVLPVEEPKDLNYYYSLFIDGETVNEFSLATEQHKDQYSNFIRELLTTDRKMINKEKRI